MAQSGNLWSDLGPRAATAIVLVLVGGLCIWQGAIPYTVCLLLAMAGVVWELTSITLAADMWAKLLCLATSVFVFLSGILGPFLLLGACFTSALVFTHRRDRVCILTLLGSIGIALSVGVLLNLRGFDYGLALTIWFIGVVVMSDIGAYFTGRLVGGAKLWPAVSPGKTRSGAMGGVAWAFLFGCTFAAMTGANVIWVAIFSVVLSVASMAGDLAQSAVKRAYNVKDSGTLLPGHGGLWDRFDGVIGAAMVAFVLSAITSFPANFW